MGRTLMDSECIADYITFYVDSIVPTRTVHYYPTNKTWVTKDIKIFLNEGKTAFTAGNREGVRTIYGELKVRIREAKEKYRKKLEWKLQ